jgi:hypothetical protein
MSPANPYVIKELTKSLVLSLICLVTVSCMLPKGVRPKVASPFIEGNIRIVPPVEFAKNKRGMVEAELHNDGGTKMMTIIDSTGKSFRVYIDHRLSKKKNWGTIYLNGYPDTPGSIRLKNQRDFKEKIMKAVERKR